jgi:hypothetical protein
MVVASRGSHVVFDERDAEERATASGSIRSLSSGEP